MASLSYLTLIVIAKVSRREPKRVRRVKRLMKSRKKWQSHL